MSLLYHVWCYVIVINYLTLIVIIALLSHLCIIIKILQLITRVDITIGGVFFESIFPAQ